MKMRLGTFTVVLILSMIMSGCGNNTTSDISKVEGEGSTASTLVPSETTKTPTSNETQTSTDTPESTDTPASTQTSTPAESTTLAPDEANTTEGESSNNESEPDSDGTEDNRIIVTAGGYEVAVSDLDHQTSSQEAPIVYYTHDISSESLTAIYEYLEQKPEENEAVAVKIHTGEGDGSYNFDAEFIKGLVQEVNGTIVECNTAYGGQRASTAMHLQVAEEHGYTAIADVDIMDADGSMELPVTNGTYLETDLVGAHLKNYDFCLVLSHFKGHEMGGFGGALKNTSIGIASKEGKCLIHTSGVSNVSMWGGEHISFIESMAEAASAVYDYFDNGEKIVFINVMNNVSIDCDCNAYPARPNMSDVGIFASLDPVAVDQACVDFLYAVPDGDSVIRRMQSRDGELIFDHASEMGFCSREYSLVSIDD